MGGLLQAYGQSNAGQTFADVTKNMVGVAKAGYDVEQNRQEMGMKERSLNVQDAYLNIARAEEERKAADFKEKQAQQEKFYPASFFFGAEPSPSQQELLKIASDSGFAENIGGTVGMRAKNFKPFLELLSTQPQLTMRVSQTEINHLNQQIAEARTNISTMPEGDKRAQAEANLGGLLQRLQVQADAYTSLVKSSPEFIEKAALASEKGGSNVKGFNPDTKKPVIEDVKGNLWEDGKPYQGGPLMPTTTATGGPSWHVVPDKTSKSGYRYEDLNTGKQGAEAPAPRLNQEDRTLTPAQRATMTLQTRKEFNSNPIVRQYYETKTQVEKMEQAIKESATAKTKVAVDQALITVFNKMMDPTSVVRESEYARTPSDQALFNRIKGKYDKIVEGGAGLTDVEREGIIRMGRNFGKVNKAMYEDHADYYRSIASGTGLNPEHVVRPERFNTAVEALGGTGGAGGVQIAPAGTKAKLPNGEMVTSDGKGGWN